MHFKFKAVPIYLFLFLSPPPPPPPPPNPPLSSLSHYISLPRSPLIYIYLCPSRWRCEIFKTHFVVWGQCTSADGPSPNRPQCMQISIQSSPGCFQYNTSASGPVLIPLYPQPMHCFIQSNALSAMSTWTSGHITETPPPTQKKKCVCARGRECVYGGLGGELR